MKLFNRQPIAKLTATTNHGTFRWVQTREHGPYFAFLKVGRKWVPEHRLDANDGHQIGALLRDLGWD